MRSIVFGFAAFVLFIATAQATTFVAAINFPAGGSAHVTVYDAAGIPLSPATSPVTWPATLPSGMTITPDATGYVFSDPNVAPSVILSAAQGIAAGLLQVTVTAPQLKFSSP